MIGQEIFSVPSRARHLSGLLMVVVAGMLGVGLATGNSHLFWAALFPAALGFALPLTAPRSLSVTIGEDALLIPDSKPIPYETIQALLLRKQCQNPERSLRPGQIDVIHTDGSLVFPARLNVPTDQVYVALIDLISVPPAKPVNAKLQTHYDEQVDLFDEEQVHVFNGREKFHPPTNGRRFAVLWLMLIATGIAWFVHGLLNPAVEAWTVVGFFTMIVSGIGLLISLVNNSKILLPYPQKHWSTASLIVSPGGIALTQEPHSGILRWEELKDVEFGARSGKFVLTNQGHSRAIFLKVSGAAIPIFDVYDKPLVTIHRMIQDYWRPPTITGGRPAA